MMKFKKFVMMTICTIIINGCVTSALTQLTGETHSLYKIGANGPNGGKIYYLDDSGEHGLEAKIADEPFPLPWLDAIAKVKAYNPECAEQCWHVPSKTELELLYEQKDKVGGFNTGLYWSSTQNNDNKAWSQDIDNGNQFNFYDKAHLCRIRAVRSF